MPNVKICFLDIDGVLNSIQQTVVMKQKGYRACELNKISFGLIKWVCEFTDAKIVISSTWRSYGVDWMKGVFEAHEWYVPPIIGQTRWPDQGTRGSDIEHFLQEYDESEGPLESYVIIDDDSDMFDYQLGNFVQTDPVVGFSLYDAIKAIDILGVLPEYEERVESLRKHTIFQTKKRESKAIKD